MCFWCAVLQCKRNILKKYDANGRSHTQRIMKGWEYGRGNDRKRKVCVCTDGDSGVHLQRHLCQLYWRCAVMNSESNMPRLFALSSRFVLTATMPHRLVACSSAPRFSSKPHSCRVFWQTRRRKERGMTASHTNQSFDKPSLLWSYIWRVLETNLWIVTGTFWMRGGRW